MNTKQAVETIVYNDDPKGLKQMRIAGSNLIAFIVPRADIKNIKEFHFSANPAVYFLLNEDDRSVYIGKTDNFQRRMQQQEGHKDYWEIAVGFIAQKDLNVAYLEKKCHLEAKLSNRYKLMNDSNPPGEKISEFIQVSNNKYFYDIKFLLALSGYSVFGSSVSAESKADIYHINKNNFDANAKGKLLDGNEFIVFKDSTSRKKTVPSYEKNVPSGHALRVKLIEEGVLKDNGKNLIFTQDYTFSSPSAAATTVLGRASNGWIDWKDKNGKTLDENIRK